MKQNNSALLLPFYTSDLPKCKADVEQNLKELEVNKSKLESECKKLHLNHTKLFIHFEQQCLDKQIELLKWVIIEQKTISAEIYKHFILNLCIV